MNEWNYSFGDLNLNIVSHADIVRLRSFEKCDGHEK